MKQLSCAALALCLLLPLCAPSRAIQVLIPAGTSSTPVSQLLTDSATGQTGQPGLTGAGVGVKVACVNGVAGSITITVKAPGTTAVVNGQGSVADEGNGNYAYFPIPAETPQTGSSILYVHFAATGYGPQDASGQIVPALPGIIITNTDKTGYIVAGGTVGSVTGSVGSVSGITLPSDFLSTAEQASLIAAANAPASTVAALNADTLYNNLVHHQMGKFRFNPASKTLQLLKDDGTLLGLPMTLTVDTAGNIISRQ